MITGRAVFGTLPKRESPRSENPHEPEVKKNPLNLLWRISFLMRILYVLTKFPVVSETFILNEIAALSGARHDIRILTLLKVKERRLHRLAGWNVARRTVYLKGAQRTVMDVREAERDIIENEKKLKKTFLNEEEFGRYVEFKSTLDTRIHNRLRLKQAVCMALILVKRHGTQHIHCHFGDLNTEAAAAVCGITGIPFTFTMHGYDIFFKVHPQIALLADQARKVIAVSAYNKAVMIEKLGISEQQCPVIPGGIDLDLFKRKPVRREKKFTILSVARLHPVKGLRFLIEALRILADQGKVFQCWIIGEGFASERKALKDQIRKNRLERFVSLLGNRRNEDLPAYYSKADVFVLPSLSEGSPTVLKEAMACGTPVIATRVNGVAEIVKNSENGFLVDSQQAGQLAEKILEVMAASGAISAMRSCSRNFVEEKFDLKKNVRLLEEVFAETKCASVI